jgi:type IV pilus assembly protein PilB
LEVSLVEHLINCWNCLGEYDALSAVWCSCNPNRPTKVCPFCLLCFCNAPEDYHAKFWSKAPSELVRDREMLAKSRGPLGEALVKAKAITSDQLLMALKRQEQTKGKLGEILVEMGFLTADTLAYFLAQQRSVLHVSLHETPPDPLLIAGLGATFCAQKSVIPLNRESLATKEILTLGMADPSDGATIDHVQNLTGCQILPVHTSREEILQALEPFLQSEPEPAPPEEEETGSQIAMDLLRKALARNASDIYLEPKEEEVSIHLRIDGILYKAKPIPKQLQAPLVGELKRLLRLNPEINDRPQEGRVGMKSGEHRFDLIAHSLPTRFGENVSVKIIGRDTFLKSPEQLGIPSQDQMLLKMALAQRSGVILVSAPLFHGSTTTLYSIMNEMAGDTARKLMSIETQSICPVPNVSQVSLGEGGDTEATATTLKAMANIQPDACVLGDLLESSNMASQMMKFAPQMLMVATMEASTAITSVSRILDLGVSPGDLAQHLGLVINQRLVRRVCPDCRQEVALSKKTLVLMGLTEEEADEVKAVYQGQGCPACSMIGYRGRLALFETLAPSPGFRKALGRRANDKSLEKEAVRGGMVTLRQRGLAAVKEGHTTLEEFQKGNF